MVSKINSLLILNRYMFGWILLDVIHLHTQTACQQINIPPATTVILTFLTLGSFFCPTQQGCRGAFNKTARHSKVGVVIDWHIPLQDVIHYHNCQPNPYNRKMTMHLSTLGNNSFHRAPSIRLINESWKHQTYLNETVWQHAIRQENEQKIICADTFWFELIIHSEQSK